MIPIYVDEIKNALHNKCYFPALALTLALPDMCGMVEYPNEDVSKRYINWIDKYLGEQYAPAKGSICESNPRLTGEVIYNLRNTYLHQGSPNLQSDKIKEEVNKVDKFALILGDGSVIWDAAFSINSPKDKDLEIKIIIVDISYLCESICNCSLEFFNNNQERFNFDFYAMTQEEFINLPRGKYEIDDPEWAADLINRKLKSMGSTKKVETTNHPVKRKTETRKINRKY